MDIFGDLNSEKFLKEAFDPASNPRLTKAARLRRNVYFALLLCGVVCICITVFAGTLLLSVLSVGLTALSLALMSRYETQVHFLQTLRLRQDPSADPDGENDEREPTE